MPSSAPELDVKAIKAQTDLLRLISSDLGEPEKSSGRWHFWLCPFHPENEASFCVTPDNGQWHCFSCGRNGDAISWLEERRGLNFLEACRELNGNGHWTPEQIQAYKARMKEREAEEEKRKRQAIDRMAEFLPLAMDYHDQMQDRSYWYSQGLTDDTVDLWGLGYCPSCPTYPPSPSWTIPVLYKGKLLNIRHRLARPPSPGDKYRPHMTGLPATLFNADVLSEPNKYVVLVEGEIKTIVLSQMGFAAVGIPGKNIFPDRWAEWFRFQPVVYVALDPDANGHATNVCQLLGSKSRLVTFPVKPDDFAVLYGGDVETFKKFLRMGRKIR